MAATPKPFTWFQLNRSRFAFEVDQLESRYPQLRRVVMDGRLHVSGTVPLDDDRLQAPALELDVTCEDCHPACAPKVRLLSPDLSAEPWGHQWHLWQVKTICFIRPTHWEVSYSVADVVDKVNDWYFNYVAVKHGLAQGMPQTGRVDLG